MKGLLNLTIAFCFVLPLVLGQATMIREEPEQARVIIPPNGNNLSTVDDSTPFKEVE